MKKFEEVYTDIRAITLNVTNNCNLRCSYCFEKAKAPEMMSPEIAVKAIDKAYRKLEKEPFTINFFGGEPLLNWPAVKAVIDHCEEKNYIVRYGITTNLTILTDEMLEYFDRVSMPVLVSIDGIKEVHDKNRCKSYDTVLKNLKKLIDIGLTRHIEARLTVLPEDVKYTLQGLKEIYALGIDNLCPIPVTDIEWDEQSLKDCRQFYKECNEWFLEVMKNPPKDRNLTIKNIDDLLRHSLVPEQYDTHMCPIFQNTWCTVDWEGKVYCCHQGPTSTPEFKEELCMGDIDYIDETKIRENPMPAEFLKEECNTCVAKVTCKSGCPVENLRENRNYNKCTQAYCDIHRMIAEESLRIREELLSLEITHNHNLSNIRNCLRIKDYVDKLVNTTNLDISNNLQIIMQVTHIGEMVDNLGGDYYLLPSFKQYIQDKLRRFLISLAVHDGVYLRNEYREVK